MAAAAASTRCRRSLFAHCIEQLEHGAGLRSIVLRERARIAIEAAS